MTDDEVDELLKAVETSGNGEVNYTGMSALPTWKMGDGSTWSIQIWLMHSRSRPNNPRKLNTSRHVC